MRPAVWRRTEIPITLRRRRGFLVRPGMMLMTGRMFMRRMGTVPRGRGYLEPYLRAMTGTWISRATKPLASHCRTARLQAEAAAGRGRVSPVGKARPGEARQRDDRTTGCLRIRRAADANAAGWAGPNAAGRTLCRRIAATLGRRPSGSWPGRAGAATLISISPRRNCAGGSPARRRRRSTRSPTAARQSGLLAKVNRRR